MTVDFTWLLNTKIASVHLTGLTLPGLYQRVLLASDDLCELLSHHILAFHLLPRNRWNGVDPNPAFVKHAKEMESDRVHQITQTLGPNTKCRKVSRSLSFIYLFSGQYPPFSISIYPLLSSIYLFLFISDLFTFEFLHTNLLFHLVVYSFSVLPCDWPFCFILPPFLQLSSPPGLGCNSACFSAS